MEKTRLAAFGDNVTAIIITIMVLELKPPAENTFADWRQIAPRFVIYLLSFFVIAVFWVNHHHVFQTVKTVDGKLIWTNVNFLFWLSLIPFVTAYMGGHSDEPTAIALYGVMLSICAVAFTILRFIISRQHLDNYELTRQHKHIFRKNIISIVLYALSVPIAFFSIYLSYFIFILIPAIYFLPERKLEEQAEKIEV